MSHPHFLRVAYLGTDFSGWQIQTVQPSVQAALWASVRALEPGAPLPQGTGRTDAGVHARAQGVLIQLSRPWDDFRLLAALNARLPRSVRVMAARPAHPDFWPRQHAVAKRYVYRLAQGPAEDPFGHATRWHVRGEARLDAGAMAEAARALLGTHDFSCFRAVDCAAAHPVRTIFKADVVPGPEGLDLVFEGNRFLMHQVRIMAGTLVEVGRGRRDAGSLRGLVDAKDRTLAGPTAPPHGLCLEEVWYQARWGVGAPSPWPERIPEQEAADRAGREAAEGPPATLGGIPPTAHGTHPLPGA
ncbi:MAG: tRNA pseudouridine(38-40) synthase TruA [Holophagaceae bacterium]|nr:tRNA pseudouridine(38-40) synthase TruA [Holophagaceae bacterium]